MKTEYTEQNTFDAQTMEGYYISVREELREKLNNKDLYCYTAVVMALRDCEASDYDVASIKSAFARLSQDADKIRSRDYDFYKLIQRFS